MVHGDCLLRLMRLSGAVLSLSCTAKGEARFFGTTMPPPFDTAAVSLKTSSSAVQPGRR
jgi:hypothetical protein